jgi:hypothetical protein
VAEPVIGISPRRDFEMDKADFEAERKITVPLL